ncbi:MAG: DNA-processing protein DprA [Dongiaceae bacterium]
MTLAILRETAPSAATLSAKERMEWLRLSRSENIGPITFFQLLSRFGTAAKALEAVPELAKRGGKIRPLKLASAADAEAEIAAHEKIGARLIAKVEADYPPYLAPLDDAPPLISVLGHPQLMQKPCVAMVGARNASANAKKFAEELAKQLGQADYIVVSGLARGIDTHVHQGALATGTVAVLAGGVDNIYPPENKALYKEIAARGCIISEMPLGAEPMAAYFPRRNRIISGISRGVVVVEAALKSGSLITARFAAEQGREVMAIPGSPLDPRCQGTNKLLKDGATLIESAQDILDALAQQNPNVLRQRNDNYQTPVATAPSEQEITEAQRIILEALSSSPIAVDELVRATKLETSLVLAVLLELELAGRIERYRGNQVALTYI